MAGQITKKRRSTEILEQQKKRTYLDDVPEDIKEQLSRAWGYRKEETFGAAKKHGLAIEQGTSFNKVVTFMLDKGYYHLVSGIDSTGDIAPEYADVGALCSNLIDEMATTERKNGCTPIVASNVCDWDSAYASEVEANIRLRDSIINGCVKNDILLIGGETANLGDQVRKKGMSWMFTLLSKYNGSKNSKESKDFSDVLLDSELTGTFGYLPDKKNYEIVNANGIPLLHVKKVAKFVMTADGAGSKSILEGYDILDTLAMTCDDATRDGAYPLIASIGVDAENSSRKQQIIENLRKAGKDYSIPMIGCVFRESPNDIYKHIMNGVVLSEVKEKSAHIGKEIEPDLDLVLLGELQRSNGITTQRRISEETFGDYWYNVIASEAFDFLNNRLHKKYSDLELANGNRTLGELVAESSTPYFRVDSTMPEELLNKVKFRINVSSGGLFGKTRRLLEPHALGVEYYDVFEAPDLILLLQMASQLEGSKGVIPDEVAYYTWGCGTGAVIGTTDPNAIAAYYNKKRIPAKIGGIVTTNPEIRIASKCLESTLRNKDYFITHKYTDKPLG